MSKKLIESVPNFSEGRRPEVLQAILRPLYETPEVQVLNYSLDKDHNRSVVTVIGSPEALETSLFEAIKVASQQIDLRTHEGEHPRMGACDVLPFIPIRNASLEDCDLLAKRIGQRIGEELKIPVYLYEASAQDPDRKNLARIRKGQYENFAEKIKDPHWAPDFGPAKVHPQAGVLACGARDFLIAYNVNLATDRIEVADQIARKVRHMGGGLRFVKAMGVELKEQGIVQVSMNLTNFNKSSMYQVFEMIKMEARRYGVSIKASELIGLTPMAALLDAASYYLQLEDFSLDQVIESKLLESHGDA